MTNKYYQKHKKRLSIEARKKCKNLSEDDKDKRRKIPVKDIKIFLKNKSRSYSSTSEIIISGKISNFLNA